MLMLLRVINSYASCPEIVALYCNWTIELYSTIFVPVSFLPELAEEKGGCSHIEYVLPENNSDNLIFDEWLNVILDNACT
jgi:hypothetical protein